jgi:hypothetical protein
VKCLYGTPLERSVAEPGQKRNHIAKGGVSFLSSKLARTKLPVLLKGLPALVLRGFAQSAQSLNKVLPYIFLGLLSDVASRECNVQAFKVQIGGGCVPYNEAYSSDIF